MSRPTIVFVLLVAIASMVLGTYYLVFPRVADVQLREQMTGLELSGRLLQEMDVADEARLTSKILELAQRPSLRAILQEKPTDAMRENWLGRLRTEAAWLTAAARAAAPIQDLFILDSNGAGLVRNIDLHWTGKPPSDNPRVLDLVRQAENGVPQSTLVVLSNSLLRTIAVPLFNQDKVVGVLLATFPLDEVVANTRSGELGLGFYFAYVGSKAIYASTLDPAVQEALQAYIQGTPAVLEQLLSGKSVEPWFVESGSRNLQTIGAPVIASGGKGLVALVLLREITAADQPLGAFGLWLFGGAGLVLMVLVIGVALFGGRLARGVRQLERDALMIAHGDSGHTFQVTGPTLIRSLAEILNDIRSEAKAEDVDPQALPTQDYGETGSEDSEPGDEQTRYFRNLFDEFMLAKQKIGETTEKLDFGRFHAKLLKQEEALKAKHGCQAVRFEVTISSNQVKLRPRFIRDTTNSQ
jgi:hypothetical protein